MAFDSIDNVAFLNIEGQPQFKRQTLSDATRAAEDGRAFRKEGKRGKSFSLRTVVDRPSAESLYDLEATLQGGKVGTVVTFVKNGVPQANFLIEDVELKSAKKFFNSTGGVVVPPNEVGWVGVFEWQLVYAGT